MQKQHANLLSEFAREKYQKLSAFPMPEGRIISCARKPVNDTSRRIFEAFGRAPASEGPATFKRDAEVPAEAENDLLRRGEDESVLAFDRPQFEFDRAQKWQTNNGGLEV